MAKLISAWLLYCCALPLWAQTGSYFLSHHAPAKENFDNVCFDMAQDRNGIMYFAMKAGVLEFDGHGWALLPAAGAVYALHHDASGEVFWAGAKGFGKIGSDEKGLKQLHYLSDPSVSDVFQTLAIGRDAYFLSENKIFIYRAGKSKAEVVISANAQNLFTGMFELFDIVYVQTERNITFKVEENKLVYTDLKLQENVIFHSRIDDTYVLGTSDNRIFSCYQDLVMRPLSFEDQSYADANVVVSGTWVNRELLALGTLRGGVMLINPLTGKRDQIIDYSAGLPDNEVFSLIPDANQNLWVAHEYGFTQVSPTLPFRSFSHYPGLKGNMLCAYSFRGNVYVGTSVGLFKLDKDEIYDDVVSFVDVEIDPGQSAPKGVPPEVSEETPSKKRGLFNFLRRNRKKEKSADKEAASGDDSSAEEEKGVRRVKRITKVLRSSQHIFKNVTGIAAKITHLVETDGKLIAAGLEGVFEVDDLVSKPILHSPTRYVYASRKQETIIASTYNDEIWSLQPQAGWQQLNLINSLGDQIDYIFEGAENEWWLCGLDRIYQLQLNEQGIERLQTIELFNPNFEKTVGLYHNNQIVLVNADGFYHFERDKNQLSKIDSLPKPAQYFAFDGHILYRDEHRWNFFGAANERSNLQLLNLFQNLRFLTTDQDAQNLWMISGSNELLKFYGENISVVKSQFPIFLKSVQNDSIKIADLTDITIDQNNSAVAFEVVQPDFINPRSIEFRYFLDGMQPGWSDWSSGNNKISFPYLPPGEYVLNVQARNIFNQISTLKPLPFAVIPPYWKQSWFYALEFIVFASLVILSFRLSTRYRIISRLLSLITIILLIEFIQTVIGSSIITGNSPVMEFFIQVVVALLILPVEGFLRNLMLRSLDSSGKLYNFISSGSVLKEAQLKKSKKKAKETL